MYPPPTILNIITHMADDSSPTQTAIELPVTIEQTTVSALPIDKIQIHVPSHMNNYTTNLKYLATIYQEKLQEILQGRLPKTDLDKINEIVRKKIADSL